MPEPKFMVNSFTITNSTIKVDAVAAYYRDDIVPKARIIFENGSETRRLPLILRNTYKYKAESRYYAIFSYSYNLNYIFSGGNNTGDFNVYFEINYGDVCEERVRFAVSDGIAAKYGVSPLAVAAAWILRHPAKIQVISGSVSPERMRQVAAGAEIEISREDWYAIYRAAGFCLP